MGPFPLTRPVEPKFGPQLAGQCPPRVAFQWDKGLHLQNDLITWPLSFSLEVSPSPLIICFPKILFSRGTSPFYFMLAFWEEFRLVWWGWTSQRRAWMETFWKNRSPGSLEAYSNPLFSFSDGCSLFLLGLILSPEQGSNSFLQL